MIITKSNIHLYKRGIVISSNFKTDIGCLVLIRKASNAYPKIDGYQIIDENFSNFCLGETQAFGKDKMVIIGLSKVLGILFDT